VEDRRCVGTGDAACDVYPPGLVTVVRDRCFAGGLGDDGVGVGKSSGCGCAGSLRLFGSEGVVEALWVSVAGWPPVLVVPVCARYHSRMVAALLFVALEMRWGGRCGADLSSQAKRGPGPALGRPYMASSELRLLSATVGSGWVRAGAGR
jgi:hypothetical protein